MGINTRGASRKKRGVSPDDRPFRRGPAPAPPLPSGVRRETGGRADARTRQEARELAEQAKRVEAKERLLGSMGGGLGRAVGTYRKAGELAFGAEKALAESLLGSVGKDPTALAGPLGLMGSRLGGDLTIGPEITKASRGEEFDPRWAGVEAAGFIPFFRPLRALRAAKAAKAGQKAVTAPEQAITKRRPLPGKERAEIVAEIESIKNDPATYDYHAGRPDVRPQAARRLADLQYRLSHGGAETAPKLAPVASPPPSPSPADKVRESLAPARSRRAEQQRGYREERTKRIAAAEAASEEAGGGIAGYKAAGKKLAGELPKVKFEHLRKGTLGEQDLDDLVRTVQQHPELRPFQKRSAIRGLLDAYEQGRVPQKAQIKHWQTVFGEEAVSEKTASSVWKAAGNLINIPRSLMSTLDLSGTLRQGLVAAVAHPKIVARNMKPQVKALLSEKNHAAIMDEIHARPNADRYERSGLPLTTLDDIATREEQFSSGLAETLTGGKRFSPVRASGRAYTGFLNKTRADVFDLLDELARAEGVNVESAKFERDLARLVGSMTGRGPLPQSLQGAATFLNATFFSPRLAASRIDLLFAPLTYAKTDPFVRKQALRSMLRLYAAGSAILALAAAAGGKVSLDPRNGDFAKVRIGNSRIDIFGGFQQYVRLLAQITSGTIISSASGKKLTLGAGFGDLSRWDIIERFGVSKFSPPASFVTDFFKGTDFEGKPFEWKKATLRRLEPFISQDLRDIYNETKNIPATVGGAGLIGFGVGVQTYSSVTPKERQAAETSKRYSEWEASAKEHFDGEIPTVLVRAKRNDMLVKDARRRLAEERGYEKLSELTEQDELRAYVSVFLEQNPDVDPEPFMQLIQTASPVVALEASKRARKLLGINLLSKYGDFKGKRELAEREKAFANR